MSLDLTSVNREWKNPMMQQHISEIVIQKLFKFLNCFLCSISNFLNKKKTIARQYLSSFKLFGNKKNTLFTLYLIKVAGLDKIKHR